MWAPLLNVDLLIVIVQVEKSVARKISGELARLAEYGSSSENESTVEEKVR